MPVTPSSEPALDGSSRIEQRATSEVIQEEPSEVVFSCQSDACAALPERSRACLTRLPQNKVTAPCAEMSGCRWPQPAFDPRTRKHHRAQRRRREWECHARHAAVAYADRAARQEVPQCRAAAFLGIAPRTLRYWKKRHAEGVPELRYRGRPPVSCNVESRNEVIRFLHRVTGPAVGMPALQPLFPAMPRVILEDLLRRYRCFWRRRYRENGFELTWHHAGAVWAMDFSEAPHPIDGIYSYIFAVRDLASHQQLAWEPVADETAESALPILQRLFAEHGPPLVLKSDNGSAFISETIRSTMLAEVVAQLFSPPRRPQYNGALERSNGVHKVYTQQHAVIEGHPCRWTSNDLEHARHLANTMTRPWGPTGPTPEQAWQQRSLITDAQREQFQRAFTEARIEAANDLGFDLVETLRVADRARLDRLALSRTVARLEYLTMKRVTRPPRKPKRPSHEEIARRARKHRGDQRPESTNDSANAPPPSRPPSDTTCTLVLSPDRVPATSSTKAQACYGETKSRKVLASAPKHVTMQQVVDADLPPPANEKPSTTTTSAQRERASPSWLRRLITPFIFRQKAASIR